MMRDKEGGREGRGGWEIPMSVKSPAHQYTIRCYWGNPDTIIKKNTCVSFDTFAWTVANPWPFSNRPHLFPK